MTEYLLSKEAIKMDSDTDNYHFLVGLLTSEIEGERSYIDLYGFTEILPGRITTDKIVSSDGNFIIDLLMGVFEIFNKAGESMIKLDGADGSGHFAAKNLIWDAFSNLSITGTFQTNTPKGEVGVRIIAKNGRSDISFHGGWSSDAERIVGSLSSEDKNKTITAWNPATGRPIFFTVGYNLGKLELSGLGGCSISGNEARFGSTEKNDSYIKINWENNVDPPYGVTSPVAGPLDIEVRGVRVSNGSGLDKYKMYVDTNGFLKLKL